MQNRHPPKDFASETDVLKYDLEKSSLAKGERRTLIFNICNFIETIRKGRYSLKIYVRVGNRFGYDEKGKRSHK
jgi:hypothetical protein